MKIKLVLFISFALSLQYSSAQIGRLALSPLEQTSIKIGTTDIELSYCRPSMRGRTIFGDLVPYNQWWRTGANRNTTIRFSEAVILGDTRVDKGKYAIFTKPNKNEWEIMLYTQTDNWDVPEKIDTASIAAKMTVQSNQTAQAAEVLSITIGDFTNYQFNLNIGWENTSVIIPIQLTTAEIMEDKISKTLNGPRPHDYYSAALYEMESGGNYERGLAWINTTIQLRENPSWWDLRIKSILLLKLDQKEEALPIAEQAFKMAKNENHAYGINEMKRIINLLSK